MSRTGLIRLACVLSLSGGLVACDDEPESHLKAFQAEREDQLIGGDVAMARVGDYILENDKIRIAILGEQSSPGPGVYGGTLVDADLQRVEERYRGGRGHDQFAEIFPFANLLVPKPGGTDISVVNDGSDGKAAIVRVSAEGAFFLHALGVLEELLENEVLKELFEDVRIHLRFETDYILEPGASYVRMVTRATRIGSSEGAGECAELTSCDLECATGLAYDEVGCLICECAPEGVERLTHFTESTSIFEGALGEATKGIEPGLVAGDFTFFGAQNDLFAPGMGFDEERAVFEPLFEGRDPFTYPLALDYMAAAGGAVSYGYFSVNGPGETEPRVLVPIITSSTTAFSTSELRCGDDDPECRRATSWEFERYLAVGDGDIASIADIVHELRGTPTGRLEGAVLTQQVTPAVNARVFVIADPDPDREWTNVHELTQANRALTGMPGVMNAIDADVGLDPVEDGAFSATLPVDPETGAMTYMIVAASEDLVTLSPLQRVVIRENQSTRIHPMIQTPGRVSYQVTDTAGSLLEAKIVLVPIEEGGALASDDGRRRPYLGEGRLGNGIKHLSRTITGSGELRVEPGSYRVFASRGPEYSRAEVDVSVSPGEVVALDLVLHHEVDTTGWINGDFHLHAEPSFDSGMKLEKRVETAIVEGVDLAVATDHDVITDYAPILRMLQLESRMASGIGVELSSLEMGHFIAFPTQYDELIIPHHGAPDWMCMDGPQLMDSLQDIYAEENEGVRIMAHPRDGFIGYISQLEVDPYTLERKNLGRPKLSLAHDPMLSMEGSNPLFSESTCEFEAMEVFNSKRFDQIRTPTEHEVVHYNLCLGALQKATTVEEVAAVYATDDEALEGCSLIASYEGLSALATCAADELLVDCKMRHRRTGARIMASHILTRTPEEQCSITSRWGVERSVSGVCPEVDGEDPPEPELSPDHVGVADDWFRWLEAGLNITVTGASDSHGSLREPGMPRALVRSDADTVEAIDAKDAARAIRDHQVLATYGPVVDMTVAGRGPGELVTVAGEEFELDLRVQTASWFGVDRIEIYVSGDLAHVETIDHGPKPIVDFEGTLTLPAPNRDGTVAVIVMGLNEENLMGPTYLNIPYGEVQLPRIATMAFKSFGALGAFVPDSPWVPDLYPVFPMAMTNAILLDADADGAWKTNSPAPAFCPRPCVPGEGECPGDQVCLEDRGVCGYQIDGQCHVEPTKP
ncbi:MAG: hypothetical protein CL940_00550 [Deltaproteobacteria bacterium]|nr:hypothetical protein [Deltaproteobacteria bacterium]